MIERCLVAPTIRPAKLVLTEHETTDITGGLEGVEWILRFGQYCVFDIDYGTIIRIENES